MKLKVELQYIMTLLIFMLIITGCSYKQANKSDEIFENKESVITEETIKEKDPLSIETPSGVILVGIIDKDDTGWYFIPEQPLNIKLTFYIDNPEIFNKVTRLEMLSNSEDGFDKIVYEKQVVTITGGISNPRGLGKLYIIPYKIEMGKTVEKSIATPDLQAPIDEEVGYDPELLPDKMKPILENSNYLYNPYLLSTEALTNYGNEFASFYVDFVDAYLNYKTSVNCPSKKIADYLSSIIYYELPMFNIDTSYSSIDWYNSDNSTISWSYTKNQNEHNAIIQTVRNATNKFLSGVQLMDSETDKAKKIYTNFNQNMQYDYDAMKTRNNIESYYAYANNKGICVTFALAYSQLLTQVGIESTISSGMLGNGEGHVWNVITIDGIHYFTDPTYQITSTKEDKYFYFGMSLSDRLNDGSNFNKEEISIGKYNVKNIRDVYISNVSLDF